MKKYIDNPKYKDVFSTAKRLFWKYGIKRVSIEEICKEAKVSKMTFYKFYQNKKELAEDIINTELGNRLKEFRDLVNSDLPFTDKVHKMFVIKLHAAHDISQEFIADIYKNKELGLHERMEQLGQESMSIFVNFIEDAQKQGKIRKDVKIEFILAFQASVVQMMDNKDLMMKYEKAEDFIMATMNFLFYGIINKDE